MAKVPHQRSLVKRLEKKPFALLGVNVDADQDNALAAVKDKEITWRSWWDGGDTGGPISKKWQVAYLPTVYILDHKGVIRFKGLDKDALDKAVDYLLKEAQTELKGGKK